MFVWIGIVAVGQMVSGILLLSGGDRNVALGIYNVCNGILFSAWSWILWRERRRSSP
jgi:glucose dehydrogenase